jgi:hypothetical protein
MIESIVPNFQTPEPEHLFGMKCLLKSSLHFSKLAIAQSLTLHQLFVLPVLGQLAVSLSYYFITIIMLGHLIL